MGANILLVGASGHMGHQVIESAKRARARGQAVRIVAGICGSGESTVGQEIEGVENPISDKWEAAFVDTNVIIDFSLPAGTRVAMQIAKEQKKPLLVCTTGLDGEIISALEELSKEVPVIRTGNTSIGVNSMLKLVHQASKLLGESYEQEVFEIHHRRKIDAPSGTAVMLGETCADARDLEFKEVAHYGRKGETGARKPDEIGVQSVRGGDVPGEHTVFFFGDHDRLEITHRASSRSIFSDGAIRAASWLVEAKKPGNYSMFDVIG